MADDPIAAVDSIFDPALLTDDATRATPPGASLLDQLNQAKPRRGRPPGSKNRPKPNPGSIGQGGPATLVTPPRRGGTGGVPVKPGDKPDPATLAKAKAEKTEAYTKRILDEANQNIMLLLISVGIPTNFLYKEGKAPAQAVVNESYTDLGNAVAIKPAQAKALASFATELEFTPGGQNLATNLGTGYGPLVIKGLFAVGAGAQYLRGLSMLRKQLEPMFAAQRAYQESQRQAQGRQQVPDQPTEQEPGPESPIRRIGGLQ